MTVTSANLSLEDARRIFLVNQRLSSPAEDPLQAAKALIAVQTQYAASLPGALMARSRRYQRGWEEGALADGRLIKSWSLRHTLHTHAAEEFALILAALGERYYTQYLHWMASNRNFEPGRLEALYEKILSAVAEGPLSRPEIHRRVPELAGLPGAGWGLDLKGLTYRGLLAFANNAGASRFRRHTLAEHTLGPAAAREELMLRYFAAYGPATYRDFLYWSQTPAAEARAAFANVREQLTAATVAELEGERYIVGTPEVLPGTTRLLPKFDALVMAHRDKALFLSPDKMRAIVRPAGQIEAVVLDRAEIIGTWRQRRSGQRLFITIEPFGTIKTRAAARMANEAHRLAKSTGLESAEVTISS